MGMDHLLHFVVAGIVSLIFLSVTKDVSKTIVIMVFLIIGKEIVDALAFILNAGGFDYLINSGLDIFAGIVGTVVGGIIVIYLGEARLS